MDKNIIITNPDRLGQIKKNFKQGGPEQIQILSDFDRTLTCGFRNGRETPSLISILRDRGYLTPDYSARAKALAAKYKPIEADPAVPLVKKKAAMVEWWTRHFQLLFDSGLTKKDIERAIIANEDLALREGAIEFFGYLGTKKIPLIIFSSSGLGFESINFFLSKAGLLSPDIHIISNALIWDETGRAIGVRQPIIHSFNKDETLLPDFPFFSEIADRRNVILLGDTIGDIGMAGGFSYKNLLKIGFLNTQIKENLPFFKQAYDVIILNDGSFDFINKLFKEIID